jgi:type III restriction enzyme
MIKEQIVLNPALDAHDQEGRTLNQVLMDLALQKRQQIAEAYQKLGININPLLLIQLPNDSKVDETLDDKVIKDEVLQYLEAYKGITINNHKLAVWLSGRKDNLAGIEQQDNLTEVLLFKQAIALGWDCPRAAVLLIFRANKSETFTIQTVGRILRMPEQKHYTNSLLNNGYVYTDLSKQMIKVVQDDLDYIVQNKALRIEHYKSIALQSAYINTRLVRNRLNSKFKRALFETAEKLWGINKDLANENMFMLNREKLKAQLVEIDVRKIEIPIPKDVILSGEIEMVSVDAVERFAKTEGELNKIFIQFCRNNCGGYAVVDSTPVLEMSLKLMCEEYFQFNEQESVKIMLYVQNEPRFVELIMKAIELYEKMQEEKLKSLKKQVEEYVWDVPPERIYNDNYAEVKTEAHALEPFYELTNASSPEKRFAAFLESNAQQLKWWYKNGESAKEHFAIPYIDYTGKQSLFYVDFVIQTNNNLTFLFDTKTTGSDAANVHLKHNALIDYIENQNASGKNIIGGVIIPKQTSDVTTWHYCRNRIENTKDLKGWEIFNPATINLKETTT